MEATRGLLGWNIPSGEYTSCGTISGLQAKIINFYGCFRRVLQQNHALARQNAIA
jgi:hypothetical protein